MSFEHVPDAPWIREAERYGYPADDPVICPCCGEDCETIYKDMNNDVFGCDRCVRTIDAWEWAEIQKLADRPDWADE